MYLCPSEDLNLIADTLRSDVAKLRNKKIFLTGATGFIGKNLLESILWIGEKYNFNVEIFSISRNPEIFFNQFPHFKNHKQFKLFKGDICEDFNLLPIDKIDITIHAATDVVNQNSPIDVLNVCVQGTLNVLNFSKRMGCKNFLLLSSGAVYGESIENIKSFHESHLGGVDLVSPKSAYALGKQLSEWLTYQFGNDSMLVKVARCFAFVGPYLPTDKHFAIGNFIKSAISNKDIEIKGDGKPLRTYLYTSDLCIWLLKILLSGPSKSIYNVGGNEVLSIRELANNIKKELNPKIQINVHQLSSGNNNFYIPNVDKISNQLGLNPTVSIRDAIIKTANWNIKHADIT